MNKETKRIALADYPAEGNRPARTIVFENVGGLDKEMHVAATHAEALAWLELNYELVEAGVDYGVYRAEGGAS